MMIPRQATGQGWLAADAAAEAGGSSGDDAVGAGGVAAASGALATTEAGGSDGSDAGAAGTGAAGVITTAVAGGASGVCFVHATRIAADARSQLAFIGIPRMPAVCARSFMVEGYRAASNASIGNGRDPQ
jgi:hypothetical protein